MIRSKNADTIYVDLTGKATVTTHTPVMLPVNMDYVTSSSFRADWTDDTYAGVVSSYTLECTGEGNTISIPDITNKNYTLENLTAGAMYSYKVKALYTDGTESLWSNIQQVTLLAGAAYEIGDVNTDGAVNISDVTALIDYLLGGGNINTDYADVNEDSGINIADVTALIDKLLAAN